MGRWEVNETLWSPVTCNTQADVNELANSAPRNVSGDLDYVALLDSIVHKGTATGTGTFAESTSAPIALPQTFEWPGDAPLAVSLRLHNTTSPYEVWGRCEETWEGMGGARIGL